MSRPSAILLALLLLQGGVIAAMYWPDSHSSSAGAVEQLLDLAAGDIDRITITDPYDNEISLLKRADHWILPDLHELPADLSRVESLLQELTAGDHGWPVARSISAQRRFQVAEDNYQRRLILGANATANTLYLGTSPGFRKVHARNSEQEAVYSIGVNSFEIPAVAGNWVDPRLLQVRVPVRINADLYTLQRENGHWVSGTGGNPDATELDILLTTLKTLEVEGIADEETSGMLAEIEADVVMTVESLGGNANLELFTLQQQFFIQSSEYPLYFRISEADFKRLADVDVGLISGE